MQAKRTQEKFVLVRAEEKAPETKIIAKEVSEEKETPESSLTKGFLRGKRTKPAGNMSLPPALQITPTLRHTFAFSPSATASQAISVIDLCGACGGIVTVVNSTFRPWASSVKINKITIWPASQTSDYAISDVWWSNAVTGFNPDRESIRPIPADMTVTGACVFVPPKDALASKWMNANLGTAAAFVIQSNVGAVVYVDMSFTLANTNLAGTVAIASGVLGTQYYLSLDGPSTNKYRAIGLPTTA